MTYKTSITELNAQNHFTYLLFQNIVFFTMLLKLCTLDCAINIISSNAREKIIFNVIFIFLLSQRYLTLTELNS